MLSINERFVCIEVKTNTSYTSLHQLSVNLGKAIEEGFVEEVLPCGGIIVWKVAENSSSILLVHG